LAEPPPVRGKAPTVDAGGRSSAVFGGVMTAVELPTAFRYTVAIGAIVDSGVGPAGQLVLLVVFNGCFVLPMLLLLAVVTLTCERAQPPLRCVGETLEHRWQVTFALVVRFAGLGVLALGIAGLAA
jgi:hypothetical protein